MSVNDESDDEKDYEDPAELIKEFANHPLMQRAQKAMVAQLKETQNKVESEIKAKDNELKQLSQQRETLGVQLYGNQQQLAKLQVALENAHNEYNSIIDVKLQEEELLKRTEENNTEQKKLLQDSKKQAQKYASELEAVTETLGQIEKYNEEMKSEIALTKRAAHKAEQSMQALEVSKQAQDAYVDSLNKKVKQFQEQIQLTVQQTEVQKKETAEANAVLQDTVKELELIANEKKQLMTQWKAALAGLSRRDEALSQASQTLSQAEAAVHDFDVEIEAAKRNIMKEQANNEKHVNDRDKLENELQWVEENIARGKAEREQLQERYTMLSKSLSQTEVEAKKLDTQSKQLQDDAESSLQNLMVVSRERQRVEEETSLLQSNNANISKAVQNLMKEQDKVLKKIHERENEATTVENEIARTKVDGLNAAATNDQLKEQLTGSEKELSEKDALVEKYQVEVRQRNDEIEKKMYRVDRLNKRYEKMVEMAGGEENLGPMENVAKNLQREIERAEEECKELEREWLKRQTELVQLSSDGDRTSEENTELQARLTILSQKLLRITKDQHTLQAEVKVAQTTDTELQKDIIKLNGLISENQTQEGILQNDNYVLEMDAVEELREMERASITLQSDIASIRSAKSSLLEQIMDTERQALLWEKKIQLDKETREALDPAIGQQENAVMEKEIHRMNLRLDALKKEQERLAGELEKAVTKRAVIATRYGGKTSTISGSLTATSGTKGGMSVTQGDMKKRVSTLKKDTVGLSEQSQSYNAAIEEKRLALSEMTSELERVTQQYGLTEETNHALQTEINDLLYRKQLAQERTAYRQKFIKRMKELGQKGIDPAQALQVERRLLSASQALENVKEVILGLQESHPHLQEVLSRVLTMANPGLDNVNEL